MAYELLLFDLDDTLLDFQKSERISFRKTLEQFGLSSGVDDLYATYREVSAKLWRQMEAGEVTKEELRTRRFSETFRLHFVDVNFEEVSRAYLKTLPQNPFVLPHALELCETLSQQFRLGVVTNGLQEVQHQRIKSSGIEKWIEFMVVSEECGYPKPHPRIFEYTLKKANHHKRESVLMIGDRLESDIAGARKFGISSCWYNPEGRPLKTGVDPTYEIQCLTELGSIVDLAS